RGSPADSQRCPYAQRGGALRGRRGRAGRRRVHDPPDAHERPHPGARRARGARRLGDPRIRPRRGRRLVLAGAAWFLATLTSANLAIPYTLGLMFDLVPAVVFLHVVLAFPNGRLER